MRRFGVRADGEDASARAWVVAWTPASAKSASARTPTSLRGVSHVHVRTFRKQVSDAGRRVSWSRRVRGPRFRGRRGRHRCVVASFLEDGTHPPRTAFAVETRRVARLFAASMSMPSKPSVAFSYAGPPSRIIVAPRHARACFCRLSTSCSSTQPRNFAYFAGPAGDRGRPPVSVKCCHVRRSLLQPTSSLPLAPRVLGTPLVVNMNPAMIARNPVVVATAARPRVAARRASAAAVRQADGLVSRASVGSARRATRCAASESEADKTVSALDAILAGSQDEPAPEEVRQRVSAPQRALARSRSRATPHPRTRVHDAPPFLRLAGRRARFALLESRAPALRGFRGRRRASLCNRARLTPSNLLSRSVSCATGAPRAGGAEGTQARRGERRDEGEDAQRVRRRRRHAQQAHALEPVPEHHPGHIRARGALQTRGHLRLRSAESARDARREPNDDDDD